MLYSKEHKCNENKLLYINCEEEEDKEQEQSQDVELEDTTPIILAMHWSSLTLFKLSW